MSWLRFSNPRIPHTNWRGLAESSSWPDGSPADCSLMVGPCTTIAWPAGQGVYFRPVSGPAPPPVDTWVGSLASNGQDGTGQLYRRNRYYDPLTGRFTQEDPIGLAGGLNLYGYAGGDPVNHSDPFGLQRCNPPGSCLTMWVAGGTAIGVAGGAVVAGGCAAASAGVCVLGAPGLVAGGGALGAAAGGMAGQIAENASALVASAQALFAQGLSWWDRMKLKAKIIIGTVLTQGELQKERMEHEKAQQEQVEETKQQQKEPGEGKPGREDQKPNEDK